MERRLLQPSGHKPAISLRLSILLAAVLAVVLGALPGLATTARADEPDRDAANGRALQTLAVIGQRVVQVAAGDGVSAAVTEDGSVYMWGDGQWMQLGNSDRQGSSTPVKIERLPQVSSVAIGGDQCAALARDGSVYLWGAITNADGSITFHDLPQRLDGLPVVNSISLGADHGAAITDSGELYMWGSNRYGQIADESRTGDDACSAIPRLVSGLPKIKAVSLGAYHSAALDVDGCVWTWGRNDCSQLGSGSRTDYDVANPKPAKLSGLPPIKAISMGGQQSLALTEDGGVYAWGRNYSGELGVPVGEGKTPSRVEGLPTVAAIAAGCDGNAAVAADGSLYLWGENQTGVVGDGTTARKVSPVQVEGLPRVSEAVLGNADYGQDHCIVRTAGGSIYAWGTNDAGELGIGDTNQRLTPTRVTAFAGSDEPSVPVRASLAVRPPSIDFTWSGPALGYDETMKQVTVHYAHCQLEPVSGDADLKVELVGTPNEGKGKNVYNVSIADPNAELAHDKTVAITFRAATVDSGYEAPDPVTLTVNLLSRPDSGRLGQSARSAPYDGPKAPGTTSGPLATKNLWDNIYTNLTGVSQLAFHSSLKACGGGSLERAEYDEDAGRLAVETYAADGSLQLAREIPRQSYLPTPLVSDGDLCWGAVYQGKSYNYVLTGQDNGGEDDTRPVIRLTQYDLQWNYLGNVQLSDIDTVQPFKSGNARFAEDGNTLYLRSCRKIYGETNHQVSMTLVISQDPFFIQDGDVGPRNGADYGFVSHTFNQYVQVVGDYVYSLDHGDANPRAARVARFNADGLVQRLPDETTSHHGPTADIFTFSESQTEESYNITRATLNSFSHSTSTKALLTLGTSIDQGAYDTSRTMNVWLARTPYPTLDGTEVVWLTDYPEGGDRSAKAPYMVKVDEDRFLVMWGVEAPETDEYNRSCKRLDYVFVDANGNKLTEVFEVSAALSDCTPILDGTRVVWYTTGVSSFNGYSENVNASTPTFYEIDVNTGSFRSIESQSSGSSGGQAGAVDMFRMYNPWTGEHLYTASTTEKDQMVSDGWDYEGVMWRAPSDSGSPIWRLYNPWSGDHHYARTEWEYTTLQSQGWEGEGVAFYSAGTDGVPVYRLFNPYQMNVGTHHYTDKASERDTNVAQGWRYEDVGWYGLK